jgi:cysteine-rich repeat protein
MSVTITNGTKSDQKFFPEEQSAELGFPSDLTFVIPGSRTGAVNISVDALDQNLVVIGQGSVSGEIKVGARIDLKVQLSVPSAVCGNGVLEAGEACDDGNRVSGDGCSSNCQLEVVTPLDDGGVPGGEGDGGRDSRSGVAAAPFLQVSTGGNDSCAVRTDSTLWCWGDNTYGQLRIGDTANRLTPVNVGDTAWNRVSCGQSHSCALRTDGSLSCWGNNTSGQLGNLAVPPSGGQTEVAGGPWQSISAGSYQTCAIKQDGTLWCWGDNTNGQIGIGTLDTPQTSPAQVTLAGVGMVFSHVSSNYLHTCTTTSDGSLWCWGLNSDAQTGDLNSSFHLSPVQVDGAGWKDVSTGLSHTCALKSDGTLWCWGGNENGQLGSAAVSTGKGSQSAVAVQLEGTEWKSVSNGQSHTCAIKLDDSLWCWGDNSYGQLGTGNDNGANVPTNIGGTGAPTWSTVSTDADHTCAVASDGSLWCWGKNASGQLGTGNTGALLVPTRVVQ